MKSLLIHLRYLQLQAQAAHNFAHGDSFVGDHELLGEMYPAYDSAYDRTIEACIRAGLVTGKDRNPITVAAAQMTTNPETMKEEFQVLQVGEIQLCRMAMELRDSAPKGMKILLDNIVEESENHRQYKIEQRLG